MGLFAKAKPENVFELAPAGMHVARCWRVVDLGSQQVEFQGETKFARRVLIEWEILGEKNSEGEPYTVRGRYTLSLSAKAKLRQMLKSWRGRDFTPAELEGFDLAHILGKPCMVNVVRAEREGREFANVETVTPLPAAMVAPAATKQPYLFSLEDFDPAIYDSLGEKLRDLIAASPEYQEIKKAGKVSSDADGVSNDDIPF